MATVYYFIFAIEQKLCMTYYQSFLIHLEIEKEKTNNLDKSGIIDNMMWKKNEIEINDEALVLLMYPYITTQCIYSHQKETIERSQILSHTENKLSPWH